MGAVVRTPSIEVAAYDAIGARHNPSMGGSRGEPTTYADVDMLGVVVM